MKRDHAERKEPRIDEWPTVPPEPVEPTSAGKLRARGDENDPRVELRTRTRRRIAAQTSIVVFGILLSAVALTAYYFYMNRDIPLRVPPTSNLPPAPGIQLVKRLPQGVTCTTAVETAAVTWAQKNGLPTRVLYSAANASDVEIIPTLVYSSMPTGEKLSDAFERQCIIFTDKYRGDLVKRERLRQYLEKIDFSPEKFDQSRLLSEGFATEDVMHLREHLRVFQQEVASLVSESPTRGIRYFRVTYSSAPRSELIVNVGTVEEGASLSAEQSKLVNDLSDTVTAAAKCEQPVASIK